MGEGRLNISLIVMFRFTLGMVLGLFVAETYDYGFSDLIRTLENLLDTTK